MRWVCPSLMSYSDFRDSVYEGREYVSCPPTEEAEGAKLPRVRCLERLQFASLTRNEFKNGCYKCQTGMIRFVEHLMER